MKENLFNPKLKNKVARNGFDLSRRSLTTMKAGTLLPTFCTEVLPADKFKINLRSFARTLPINQAAFTRLRIYHEFFFVPYRLLWRFFPQFVVNRGDGLATASGPAKYNQDGMSGSTDAWNVPYVGEANLTTLCQLGIANSRKKLMNYNATNFASARDEFGFSRASNAKRLAMQLGYYHTCLQGQFEDDGKTYTPLIHYGTRKLSAFPFLAYHKIYADYFRNNQWEYAEPWTFNADYVLPNSTANANLASRFSASVPQSIQIDSIPAFPNFHTCFDLRYVDYNRDFIVGAFPTAQFGAVSSVVLEVPDLGIATVGAGGTDSYATFTDTSTQGSAYLTRNGSPTAIMRLTETFGTTSPKPQLQDRLKLSFDILTLRNAIASQKYKEITNSTDADYASQIEAHFGVRIPSILSNTATFLGGSHQDIELQTITNNNLTQGAQATLQSMGTSQGSDHIEFEAKEHGLVMCLTYIKPLPDYCPQGFDPIALRYNRTDYAIPEFDKLGQELIDPYIAIGRDDKDIYLYGTRYYDYKTNYDVVLGNLNQTFGGDMPDFVCQLNENNFKLFDLQGPTLDYTTFKVNPSVVDSIFFAKADNSMSSDQFILCDDYQVSVVRNLDRKGMPY